MGAQHLVRINWPGNYRLSLALGSDMDNNGGTIPILLGSSENLCGNSGCSTDVRLITSGSVSAVPVPAAVWLFGSGLIGLVDFARRKKI